MAVAVWRKLYVSRYIILHDLLLISVLTWKLRKNIDFYKRSWVFDMLLEVKFYIFFLGRTKALLSLFSSWLLIYFCSPLPPIPDLFVYAKYLVSYYIFSFKKKKDFIHQKVDRYMGRTCVLIFLFPITSRKDDSTRTKELYIIYQKCSQHTKRRRSRSPFPFLESTHPLNRHGRQTKHEPQKLKSTRGLPASINAFKTP